jgi:hypothetical protein
VVKLPSPWAQEAVVSRLTEKLWFLQDAYGLLIQKSVVLIGNEVKDCPFVVILVLILLYNSLF